MIRFNELRVSNKTNKLIIDVSVEDVEYFKNNYITGITICDDSHFKDGTLPEIVAWKKDYSSENLKHVRVELSMGEFKEGQNRINADLNNSLLFVYVFTNEETYAPDTPQELQVPYDMRTVANIYKLYEQAMSYIRELEKRCEIPMKFTDYILKIHALNLCIRTGNYTQAIRYWNKFFRYEHPCECCPIK